MLETFALTDVAVVSETDWRSTLNDLFRCTGWTAYYIPDSRWATASGFPDLTLRHHTAKVIVAELKTNTGRVTPAQKEWLRAFAASGVVAHVWRPRDMELIQNWLQHPTMPLIYGWEGK